MGRGGSWPKAVCVWSVQLECSWFDNLWFCLASLAHSEGRRPCYETQPHANQVRACILWSAPPPFLKGNLIKAAFEGRTHTWDGLAFAILPGCFITNMTSPCCYIQIFLVLQFDFQLYKLLVVYVHYYYISLILVIFALDIWLYMIKISHTVKMLIWYKIQALSSSSKKEKNSGKLKWASDELLKWAKSSAQQKCTVWVSFDLG